MLEEIPQPAKDVFLGGGSLAILGLLAHFILRVWSRGSVANTSDRSENAQIGRLEAEVKRQTDRAEAERGRADRAYHERNEAIKRAAEAVGEVVALSRRIEQLEAEVKSMREMLRGFYGKAAS